MPSARWWLVLAACLWPGNARAEVIEGIAAVVNDEIILQSRLMERAAPVLAAAQKQAPLAGEPEEMGRLVNRVLSEMIDEVLISEQAAKMKVRISSREVDRALKNMAASNNLSWPNFVRALEAQGYTLAQYRQDLRKQLLRMKVIQTKFAGRLRVADREVKTYYVRQVRQARAGDRCRLSQIVVALDGDAGAARIASRRRRAKAILARFEAGAPFAALAKRYSDDEATAGTGGALGWVDSSDLPDEIRDVVLGLSAGEVGGPIRTAEGFRLIRVLEWEASEVRPFEKASEDIRMRLLEQQMAQQERLWLADLRRKAYIDVRFRRE